MDDLKSQKDQDPDVGTLRGASVLPGFRCSWDDEENGRTFQASSNSDYTITNRSGKNRENLLVTGGSQEYVELDSGNATNQVYIDNTVRDDGQCKKVHLSRDRISLYVEFHDTESELEHQDIHVTGSVEFPEVREFKFCCGDVVWVKTKTQTWWPGKIYDPSNAARYNVKLEPKQKEWLLVGYLANSHVAWYPPSQLRPFYGNFAEMSKQNKSRGFVGAVDKAVDEFGKNVISKLMKSENASSLLDEFGEVSSILLDSKKLMEHLKSLSIGAFEPDGVLEVVILMNYLTAFYHSIGHYHRPINVLRESIDVADSAVELHKSPLVALENHSLKKTQGGSVFSAGEPKLGKKKKRDWDSIDMNSKKIVEGVYPIELPEERMSLVSESGGSESRARKKSKYLAYPYVVEIENHADIINHSCEGLTIDKSDSQLADSSLIAKCNSKNKNLLKKWSERLSSTSIPELLSIATTEYFSELRIAAVDSAYSNKSTNISKVEGFFYRFRIMSYHDDKSIHEMYNKNVVDEKDRVTASPESLDPSSTAKMEQEQREREITKENGEAEEAKPRTVLSGKIISFGTPVVLAKATVEMTPKISSENRIGVPDLNGDVISPLKSISKEGNLPDHIKPSSKSALPSTVDPIFVGFAQVGIATKRRKRRRKERMKLETAEQSSAIIPDLNGNQPKDLQGANSALPEAKPVRRRKRRTVGTPLLLTFSASQDGNPLPQKENLETELCRFGALKGIEFPISEDRPDMARVIFERKADANRANQSLNKKNPFGSLLMKHQLEDSGPSMALKNLSMRAVSVVKGGTKTNAPKIQLVDGGIIASTSQTDEKTQSPDGGIITGTAQTSETPSLDHIKQNLEMMTLMLEKSGDNLSPQTKAKLELEIKSLLNKVSTMVWPSSSS